MRLTSKRLRQLIKEELTKVLKEQEAGKAIQNVEDLIQALENHGKSKGGFKNDKIRKSFIKIALGAVDEQNKEDRAAGGVFPMYPRMFNDIVNTIEKGYEHRLYKKKAVGAQEQDTKTNPRVAAANAAIGYIDKTISGAKTRDKRYEYTFKFISANKELNFLRKNPKLQLTEKLAKWAFNRVEELREKDPELFKHFHDIGKKIIIQ